jgi:hypothetical protein
MIFNKGKWDFTDAELIESYLVLAISLVSRVLGITTSRVSRVPNCVSRVP